jgi:outer membrane murein-binding lipoprotein Lpp
VEYSTADLAKEIGALVVKVSQLEPEINRSAIDSSASKRTVEEQLLRITKLEETNQDLTDALAKTSDELKQQQLKDVAHQEAIDKLFRLVTENQKRLDGDSITNISYSNYETVRETIKIISEKLAGKGSVPYEEIVSSFTNTRFLAQVFKYMVGLFGVSGVIAAIVAITGVGGDGKVTVQKLSGEVNSLKKDVEGHAKEFDAFKDKDFDSFKSSVTNNIAKLYDRQWDSATKK